MKKIDNLPHMTTPCKDCPFRKDTQKGWLGARRMKEILNEESFTCHKTDKGMQCAGHMLLKEEQNIFVKLASDLRITLNLTGRHIVFETPEDCVKHHTDAS